MPTNATYRNLLFDTLASRCERNPRYSQRAFARDLGLAPHRLSQVLRGKQGLSRAAAAGVAGRLGLGSTEQRHFCDLVDQEHARSGAARAAAAARVARRAAAGRSSAGELRQEEFRLISDWYHLAIVELAKVKGFRGEPRWIAGTLGITEAEARLAVERLARLGIIAIDGDQLTLLRPDNVVPGGVPSEAVRTFHRRLIERALGALATQTLDERAFNTSLLAIPRARLPEARRRIEEFWTTLFAEMTTGELPPDDLYCLAIQLFHVTDRSRLDHRDQKEQADLAATSKGPSQ